MCAYAAALTPIVCQRLGFVGVVCRSQADIDANKTLEQALSTEQNFFLSSTEYHSVADVNGTRYLAQKCNRLLIAHIRKVLPKLKTSIKEVRLVARCCAVSRFAHRQAQQIASLETELTRIGESAPPEDSTQRGYLLVWVTKQQVMMWKC